MARQVTRFLIGAIGLGLLVVAAVKAASASGNTGGIVLVVAGALLLVSPFIIGRIERLSVSTAALNYILAGRSASWVLRIPRRSLTVQSLPSLPNPTP